MRRTAEKRLATSVNTVQTQRERDRERETETDRDRPRETENSKARLFKMDRPGATDLAF